MTMLTGSYSLAVGDPIYAAIEALNAIDYSTASSTPTVYATAKKAPLAAPTNVARGSATSESQVQLTWSLVASTDNGGSAITGYKITTCTTINGIYTTVTTVSSSTVSYTQSAASSSLTAGSSYFYIIQAVNAIGDGLPSAALEVTVAAAVEQLSPATTALTTPTTTLKVRISWLATTEIHSSAVTEYEINIKDINGIYRPTSECDGSDGTIFG